ncbi:hypothetical protein ABVB69_06170 [Streptomyces sp. NPDC000349]|uniref:hypothetical protein n=1 Tax=unclassified Streptomyces TaxID=2593676 RepID=UPI002780E058|nr:hypothetical protein [Streptomyces sp. DSM 40167]MDQ0407269.1 hypothetical protein [Streptomyces sp. DSM 40167]
MGADSAKGSKGRLAVQSLGVVSHGDQESDGAVRADAHRFEQPRGVEFDEPGQALVQLVDLRGELLDALGQHAQRHVGGLGHRVLVSPTAGWAEARAGAEQLGVTEARQPFPQGGSAMTRTALSCLIAWVRALTAESLASLKIRALCTGPSPDLARAGHDR